METIDLSTGQLDFNFEALDGQLKLMCCGKGSNWLSAKSLSAIFELVIDEITYQAANLKYVSTALDTSEPGVEHYAFNFEGPGFTVQQHIKVYANTDLIELWPVVTANGGRAVKLGRVDSFSFDLAAADYRLMSYSGAWGAEFEPREIALVEAVALQSRTGRSSQGDHPWFALFRGQEEVFSGAVVWSGNWILRFDPFEDGLRVCGGLNDWEFFRELAPGENFEAPAVVLVLGKDLNAVSQDYARVGRKHWYPRNTLSASLPVEWNHWWCYEDVDIHEDIFRRNVRAAEGMGMEVCTLDAGWFGPSDPATFWYDYRGDWSQVNTQRFPAGIRALADDTHTLGMKFGIWCEIEALGGKARLAEERPEFAAERQDKRLGYVCFGNPDVQEWAYQTLRHLIVAFGADWIKLDFNLEPGAGCDRRDHGHQAGDGLYAHYQGYYRTLERVRKDFPAVVLENCSSGGLRIDLGMLRRTDLTFLSDPDWPVHDLQIFWGASTMLAPDTLLHWSFSEWRMPEPPPYQTFNPRDPKLTTTQLDYYTRISMLGVYGFSQKLPDLPAWVAERLKTHTQIYKSQVRRFVGEADLYRLTTQPRRSGDGERWCAFQYSLPDGSEHLLFVFRLPGAEGQHSIRLCDLEPQRIYTLEGFEDEMAMQLSGSELMENGLLISTLPEEGSVLLHIH
jgi:alpha-galactosidase